LPISIFLSIGPLVFWIARFIENRIDDYILQDFKNKQMKTIILLDTTQTIELNNATGYIIGAVIALLILGYLIYSLLKPDKF
jgi:K+-transporting ATPase KdpF subunit